MLDYDDFVTIKITKVRDEFGKFTHWESDTKFNNEWYAGGSTGPTFYSAVDSSLEYIRDVAQYWTIDDSNERK